MKVCNLEFSKFIEAGQHEFSSIDICMYLWTRDPAFKTIFFDGLFQFSLWAKNIKVSFHDDQYHQERVFDEMCWPSRKLFFLMSAYFDRQKPSRKAFFDVLCTSKKVKFVVVKYELLTWSTYCDISILGYSTTFSKFWQWVIEAGLRTHHTILERRVGLKVKILCLPHKANITCPTLFSRFFYD